MTIMNFQFFAPEIAQGKELVYLVRLLKEKASKDAQIIAFATEASRSKTKDAESVATKDGTIRMPGTVEQEINLSHYLSREDTIIDKLEQAMDDDEELEVWEVNFAQPGTSGKYKARYFQGYLTSFEKSASADGFVEISLTIGVEGDGVAGEATLTKAQEEAASYAFADVVRAAS